MREQTAPTGGGTPREAGREIDAEVAEKVMGYVWRRACHNAVKGLLPPNGSDEIMTEDLRGDEKVARDFDRDVPHYSTDIAAAAQVVGRIRDIAPVERKVLRIVSYPYNRTYAVFHADPEDGDWREGNGEHATELAICLAALAVVEAMK